MRQCLRTVVVLASVLWGIHASSEELLSNPMGGQPPEYDWTGDGGWETWQGRFSTYRFQLNLAYEADNATPAHAMVFGDSFDPEGKWVTCHWYADFTRTRTSFVVDLTEGGCWRNPGNKPDDKMVMGDYENLGAADLGIIRCDHVVENGKMANCVYTEKSDGTEYVSVFVQTQLVK